MFEMQGSSFLADSLSDISLSDAEKPWHQESMRGPPPRIRTLQPVARPVSPGHEYEAAVEAKIQEPANSINVKTHTPAAGDVGPDSAGQKETKVEQVHEEDVPEPDALPAESSSSLHGTRSKSL